jgi:protein phosphatase 4 regulatory subunit 3
VQPIVIEDPNIRRKIHHTFRLQYLKDVILGRALDDATFNCLNTCIIFNQIEIINHVQQDERFLRELVFLFVRPSGASDKSNDSAPASVDVNGSTSEQPSTSFAQPAHTEAPIANEEERKKEVITLLQQLCVMGKNVQLPARINLFRTLVERGVLYAVQWALCKPEKHIILAAGEILTVLLDHGAVNIRNHILTQAITLRQPTGNLETGGPDNAKLQEFLNGVMPPFTETLSQVLCRMLANSWDFALQNLLADSLRLLCDVPPPESANDQQQVCILSLSQK